MFNRSNGSTQAMDEKDEEWQREYLPRFTEALTARVEEGS